MTRTTPLRRTILHLSQIRLTDARTFIESSNLADDPAAAGIRRQLHAHPIADQHPHEVAIDPIGNVRLNEVAALVELHAIHRARQDVGHHARYFLALTGTSLA